MQPQLLLDSDVGTQLFFTTLCERFQLLVLAGADEVGPNCGLEVVEEEGKQLSLDNLVRSRPFKDGLEPPQIEHFVLVQLSELAQQRYDLGESKPIPSVGRFVLRR